MRFEFLISERSIARPLVLTSGQRLTFGRLKTCDIQLDDLSVSRRHCLLEAGEETCSVADLQSANGTYVNGQRVESATLDPGDTVRIGGARLEYVAASEARPRRTLSGASLTLTADTQPLVRKAVNPSQLVSLANALTQDADQASAASVQRYLAALHEVSDRLSRAPTVEALYDAILSAVLDLTKGDRAAVLLRDGPDAGSEVNVVALRSRSGEAASETMLLSRTVVRDVLEQGLSTFSHDALSDHRYGTGDSVVRGRIRSVMCAPMRTTEEILGVLYVDSRSAHEFNEAGVELMAVIGNQAGIALHRARLLADAEKLFLDVTKAIASLIDAKDGYTHRHSERVAAFAVRLARQLGVPPEACASIELAGLLHDVGKIGVPDAILNKPGKLTDAEFAEMRRHPAHGAAMLSHIESPRIAELLPGVLCHHERWDGTGYPDGLSGDDIPLVGRIIAVADYLDAVTSERAYKPGTSIADAVKALQAHAGRAFDPKVVAAAVALHEAGQLALPVAPGPALR